MRDEVASPTAAPVPGAMPDAVTERMSMSTPLPGAVPDPVPEREAAQVTDPTAAQNLASRAESDAVTARQGKLTSAQVASFVANGYLRFDEVIPLALCGEALAALHAGAGPAPWAKGAARANATPGAADSHPLELAFPAGAPLGDVLALPVVRGAYQSLLGSAPLFDHHHAHVIGPRHAWAQGWHADAIWDPRTTAFDLQLMFFFHDTPRAMGGTMFLPGSHLRRVNEADIARYQNFRGQMAMVCGAGSFVVFHHGIWHCGQPNRTEAPRTMWKIRLAPRVPQRLTWDLADLSAPSVAKILSTDHGWYGHEVRLEIVQRVRLWRAMTEQPSYDVDQWLTRIENEPR